MELIWAIAIVFATALATAQEYRYKNPQSTPYLIETLPDINFDINELYGGSVAINESDPSRSLYFLFKPAQGKASEDLTIWLDGISNDRYGHLLCIHNGLTAFLQAAQGAAQWRVFS